MQESPHSHIPDDEIDLRNIFKRTGAFISYLWRLLVSNKAISLLFLAAAILLAVTLRYSLPKTYRSSFIIRPTDMREKFHVKMYKDLQALVSNKDNSTLASELKISDAVAAGIVDLDVSSPGYKASPDSINYTEVTIVTTDPNQFLPIQNSLINYIEQSPYFLKLKSFQKGQIAMALEQVNKDLPQLDSLKSLQLKNYEKQQQLPQSSLMMNDLVDPTSVYKMAVDRLGKKSNLVAQQTFSDNFQLIKSCVVTKRPNWPPRILILCFVLVPVFMVICLLVLHVREVRKHRP